MGTKTARAGRASCDQATFCKVWQASSSVGEVARLLGMEKAAAMSRASVYRKSGIKLKKFDKGRPRKTVEMRRQEVTALNRVVAETTQRPGDDRDVLVATLREILAGCPQYAC